MEAIMIRFLCCRSVLPLFLLATFVCPRIIADAPKKEPPTKEQIAQWIKDLGNDEFEKRENASKRLWEAGRPAEAPLKEALKSDDQEVKRRSRELLNKFNWGIYPDTPAKVVEMIQRYQGGADADAKATIVVELLDAGADGSSAFDSISAAEDKNILEMVTQGVASAFFMRGATFLRAKDNDHAINAFDEAIRFNPKFPFAFNDRGVAWSRKNDLDRAINDYGAAIRLDPKYVLPYRNRGALFSKKKEYDRAIKDFDAAIGLEPLSANNYCARAIAWKGKKDYERSLKDYDQALELDAEFLLALNNKAWLLGSCSDKRLRDGKKALELATKACELTEWKAAFFYDVLAVAYAETGEFDKAIEWTEKALKDKEYDKAFGDETRGRLKLYKDKKPFREE
jgi:tetratricopeptide (TPR) repeat protein